MALAGVSNSLPILPSSGRDSRGLRGGSEINERPARDGYSPASVTSFQRNGEEFVLDSAPRRVIETSSTDSLRLQSEDRFAGLPTDRRTALSLYLETARFDSTVTGVSTNGAEIVGVDTFA